MLNNCCFEGRVANKPTISGDGIFFTLSVPRDYISKVTGNQGADFFSMACYKDPQRLLALLEEGSLITVRCEAQSFIDNGKEKTIFKINDIWFNYTVKD